MDTEIAKPIAPQQKVTKSPSSNSKMRKLRENSTKRGKKQVTRSRAKQSQKMPNHKTTLQRKKIEVNFHCPFEKCRTAFSEEFSVHNHVRKVHEGNFSKLKIRALRNFHNLSISLVRTRNAISLPI